MLTNSELHARIVEYSFTLNETESATVRKHCRYWIGRYKSILAKNAAPKEKGGYRLLDADDILDREYIG